MGKVRGRVVELWVRGCCERGTVRGPFSPCNFLLFNIVTVLVQASLIDTCPALGQFPANCMGFARKLLTRGNRVSLSYHKKLI